MKKILSIIILLFSIFIGIENINAQSINVGYLNSTYVTNNGSSSSEINGNGAYVGVDYDYSLNNGVSIISGIFVDFVNYNIYNNFDANIFYLRVPIHGKYTYKLNNTISIFATAGPSFVYGLGGKKAYHNGSISVSKNFFDDYNQRFDIPLGLELGLNLNKSLKLLVGYDFGLLNQKNDSKNKVTKNILHIGVGYNF